MKIRSLEALCLAGTGQQGAYGAPYGSIVRIETDDGLVGYGETDSMPNVIQAIVDAPYLNQLMSGLRALLIGQDPRETAKLWSLMCRGTTNYGRDGPTRHAMAAVDIALWDIKGKAAGKPLHALLGGAQRKELRVYASHPLGDTPEQSRDHARRLVEAGFGAIKFGWHPLGPDPALDTEIVRALRAGAGDDIDLLIDGGMAWDLPAAIDRCRRFAEYDIYWLEEPLPAYDLNSYAALNQAVDIQIAAGELASTYVELAPLIEGRAVDVLQVDLSRTGLTEAMRIAELANLNGIPCVNHTYSYDLNLAVSLHFMATIDLVSLCEYQVTPNEIRDHLIVDRPRPVDGWLAVPDGPGLGVTVDESALERFRVNR
ncbi:MAG TPA: mandelate racemase/muconate lactonizing enzyme family protein [Alphaproteobacteria bacterium]|nr:mandelate racemase/muconate lactonizing enzyme family protein [Alphaproteobacteria bacterium]